LSVFSRVDGISALMTGTLDSESELKLKTEELTTDN